jgi:hypothetical protein
MVWCPKDKKYCCDDLCHGGSCLLSPGDVPYEKCGECGVIHCPVTQDCDCDFDYDNWEDEDEIA